LDFTSCLLTIALKYPSGWKFTPSTPENNIQQRDPRFIERIVARRGSADRTAGRTSFRFEGVSL
jgi:hypothetical protein